MDQQLQTGGFTNRPTPSTVRTFRADQHVDHRVPQLHPTLKGINEHGRVMSANGFYVPVRSLAEHQSVMFLVFQRGVQLLQRVLHRCKGVSDGDRVAHSIGVKAISVHFAKVREPLATSLSPGSRVVSPTEFPKISRCNRQGTGRRRSGQSRTDCNPTCWRIDPGPNNPRMQP